MKIKYTFDQMLERIQRKELQGFDYVDLERYLDDSRYREEISSKVYKALKVYLLEKYFKN